MPAAMSVVLLFVLGAIALMLLYSSVEKTSSKSRPHGMSVNRIKPNQVNPRIKRRTIALLRNDLGAVERLLKHARQKYPGNSEQWYWEKILYDLERDL